MRWIRKLWDSFSDKEKDERLRLRREAQQRVMAYNDERRASAAMMQKYRKARRNAMLGRQKERELSGFYDGVVSVAAALAAEGSGKRLRRHRIDPAGKRRSGNLVRVW